MPLVVMTVTVVLYEETIEIDRDLVQEIAVIGIVIEKMMVMT